MTCIVGLTHEGSVFIGGDSLATAGYRRTIRTDEKVFLNGPMLIGICGSARMKDLLQYSLVVPDHDPRTPVEKWMATTFINKVRECFKDGGFAEKWHDAEYGGTFMVGYQGRLFTVYADYQIEASTESFSAIGSGRDLALGAMFVLDGVESSEPADKIKIALAAAEQFNAAVCRPFVVKELCANTARPETLDGNT
jgi:ATP-dependent protease HslVU (ClpYQ) peptidase subunit